MTFLYSGAKNTSVSRVLNSKTDSSKTASAKKFCTSNLVKFNIGLGWLLDTGFALEIVQVRLQDNKFKLKKIKQK